MKYIEINKVTNKVLAGPYTAESLPIFSEESEVQAVDSSNTTGIIYVGGTYNISTDTVSIPDSPHSSWVWNEESTSWESPVPYPKFTEEELALYKWGDDIKSYKWNETTISWDLI